jgi:Fe-S-cluster containining protein
VDQAPFYAEGLRFSCQRCSRCCRHTPGFVFLSDKDVARMSRSLGIDSDAFLSRYAREVAVGPMKRISLREKENIDCIFWENDGCSIYQDRPLQCRSFPFWSSCLSNRESWEESAVGCPGIGKGRVHSRKHIERWLHLRLSEGLIES